MIVRQLDHLNLTVSDLEASIGFYRDLLGFRVVEEGTWKGEPWAILRAGEALLCLHQRAGWRLHEDGDAIHRLNHFGLRLADVPAFRRALERTGVEVRHGGPVRWPHSTSWYVSDPTGHEIEVVAWDGDTVAFS